MAVTERAVEQVDGAGFDQLAPLGQRPSHLRRHGAGRFGDQPGNQSRRLTDTPGAGGPCGGSGDAVVQDSGDVVGVPETAGLHEARQQGIDVVLFASARRSSAVCQSPENVETVLCHSGPQQGR